MSKLTQEAQKLAPDALVELYTLDTTLLTNIYGVPGQGDVYHFCAGAEYSTGVSFGGQVFTPIPIEATGFEWNGQGKLPRPKLKVSNLGGGLAGGLTYQYDDLLGAEVTRIRTFARFLDGSPDADVTAMFEPDVFVINRKSHQDKQYIEFELAAAFDQAGVKLPKRQVLRDACSYTYRVYSGGTFHYGTCPYTGGDLFDAFENSVGDPAMDKCSHKITGCLKRYGTSAPLPIAAFPGVAQTAGA